MQALLIYLLKTTVCSGVLFGYYYLALRNKRFHYYNRFYLLMSVAISLLLPLLNIKLWQFNSSNRQVIQLMNVVAVNTTEVNADAGSFAFSWSTGMLLLYVVVSLSLLFILLLSIYKLNLYKRKYPVEQLDKILFINTDLVQAPFSFFNNLFWRNTLDISDTTGKQIFRHELTHIEQKHSWDKLFLRITTLVCWMNPFYWLIQKELSLIHEFIADEKAIENRSAEAFALVLLQSQYGKNIFSPAQSFNYSPIKRRLFMLTTSAKTNYSYARRILVLPLLVVTILLFAFTLKENNHSSALTHTNAPFTLLVDAGHGGSAEGAIGINGIKEKDINLTIAKQVQALAPNYGITVKMTRTADIAVELKDRMNMIEATHPDAFVSIHVSTTEEQQTNKNEVNVYITRTENNSNYQQSRVLGSSLLHAAKQDFPVNPTLKQRKEEGIYVIDNNPYPAVLVECGYMNNPENIKQWNDADKVEKIARDILTGVVAYANAVAVDQTTNVEITASSVEITDTTKNPPLYLLNGKELTPQQMKAIDPNTIEAISVLKNSEAIKQYGEKGKNGVVIIKLKSTAGTTPQSTTEKQTNTGTVVLKTTKADSSLIVVDGKVVNAKELHLMDPNNITTISVWKGEEAIKKYGEKGKNGVIEVTTKGNNNEQKQTPYFAPPTIVKDEVEYPKNDSPVDFTKDTYLNVLAIVKNNDTTGKGKQQDDASEQTSDTPVFPGGVEGWTNYLIKNLKADIPSKHKAPPGMYTVVVSFLVDAEGNVSEVKALKDPGFGTAGEAVRVIKEGPKWIPVETDGKAVAYRQKQAISFLVQK